MPEPARYVAIVDDEESVRRALQRLLASAGYASRAFGSGEAFLESLASKTPACVVLDFYMPMMNGLEVLDRLRATSQFIPVIVISGHDASETEPRALAAGAERYLQKPVEGEQLLSEISRLTSGSIPGDRTD